MSKLKCFMLPIVLVLFVCGYLHPTDTNIIFDYSPMSWWLIFFVNFIVIGLLSLVPVIGLYFVGSMAYNLGSQLTVVAAQYSCVPLYKILLALSIHGVFEIISMAIALNIAVEMITKPRLKRILFQLGIIGILLFVGSLLEQCISYKIFEHWRIIFPQYF